jgi:hypothetical protein
MAYLNLMQQLWQDDCGGIITSEYLLLGSILTLGTVSGMANLRDATVSEMSEMGGTMRAVREHYTPKDLISNQAQRPTNPAARPATPYVNTFGHVVCDGGTCVAVP